MRSPRRIVAIFLLATVFFPTVLFLSSLLAAARAHSIHEPRIPNTEVDLRLTSDEAQIDLQRIDFWDEYIIFVGAWRALDG
ncbi:MAG: hypothetical protein KDD84_01795, partial [Caldilineaceae bacterium]|nr:hypothetical protein [Caldilineaceae bacterium]